MHFQNEYGEQLPIQRLPNSDGDVSQNEEGLLSNSTTHCTSAMKVRFDLYQLEIRWLYKDEFNALYTTQHLLSCEHNVFC
jgi:hypothetical protein